MRATSLTASVFATAVGFFVACGPSTPPPDTAAGAGSTSVSVTPPPPDTASAAPTVSAEPTASAMPSASAEPVVPATWKDAADGKQKGLFMKAKVLPKMKEIFQAHDAKKFAEVTCKTCHGPEHKNPKEFLPKLTFKGGKFTAEKEKPAMFKFMHEKVLPAMVEVLGEKPFDMKTMTGFGCSGCHSIDMVK